MKVIPKLFELLDQCLFVVCHVLSIFLIVWDTFWSPFTVGFICISEILLHSCREKSHWTVLNRQNQRLYPKLLSWRESLRKLNRALVRGTKICHKGGPGLTMYASWLYPKMEVTFPHFHENTEQFTYWK